VALLHARAGHTDEAVTELRALEGEMAKSRSSGSLRDAVQNALRRVGEEQKPRR